MTENLMTDFYKFFPTPTQHFDTKVYNHIASLLHVSAFRDHLQGKILQRKAQNWLTMSHMCNCTVEISCLNCVKVIKNYLVNCV